MKLSTRRRFGYTRCRGGRLLRVTTDHAVQAATLDTRDPHARRDLDQWTFARVGDLAVEIVAVKTQTVLGQCYLTGTAAQLHRYGPSDPGWFEEATARLYTIPHPRELEADDEDALLDAMMEHIFPIQHSEADVAAFHVREQSEEQAAAAVRSLSEMLRLQRIGAERPRTAHILGLVDGPKGRPSLYLHLEPTGAKVGCGCSAFGLGLVLLSLGVKL